MHLAIILSISSAAMELIIGLVLWTLGASSAYRPLRWFAAAAFCAVGLSVTNVAFPLEGVSDAVVIWAGRVGGLSAAAASVAWLAYSRARRGLRALWGADALLAALAIVGGLACLAPGAIYRSEIVEVPVAALGFRYRIPGTTAFAPLFLVAVLAAIAASVPHLARAGAGWGRGLHLASALLLLLTAVNDVLVSLGVMASLYLADLSFVLMCLAASIETARTMQDNALRLERHSELLRERVEARSRELDAAREELDRTERLAGLGRLAAGVGHEINNPLGVVVNNLEVTLERVSADDEMIRPLIDDARAAARRIGSVVSQLNALTRSPPRRGASTSVRPLLERALAVVEPSLPVGTSVRWDVDDSLWVVGEGAPLEQVFVSLLSNAAQSMSSPRRPRRLTIGASAAANGLVVVTIGDSGEGISEARMEQIFEPFQTTRVGQGVGLGLAICHSIVDGLGGHIEVESEPARGTRMRVVLPGASPAEPDEAPRDALAPQQADSPLPEQASNETTKAGAPSSPGAAHRDEARSPKGDEAAGSSPRPAPGRVGPSGRARVLVVDDEPPVARALARVLSDHHVEVACDSGQALSRLLGEGERYDLVLCDLTMPAPTGAEIYAAVEQRLPSVASRFVFVTGGSVDAPARELLGRPGIRYLVKPVDVRALRAIAAAAARGHGAAHRGQALPLRGHRPKRSGERLP